MAERRITSSSEQDARLRQMVVHRAKYCIDTAREVYNNIVTAGDQSHLSDSIVKLKSLKDSAEYLIGLSKVEKKEYEKKERELNEQMEQLQRMEAIQERKKNDLEREKSRLQSLARQHTDALNNARDSERRAQDELRNATERLERVKKDEESKRTASTIGGAFLGLILSGGLPIGAVAGAAAGNTVSRIVQEAIGDVDRAKDNVRSKQNEVSNAQRRADSENASLTRTQNDLNICVRDLNKYTESVRNVHNDIGILKKSKSFAMKATHLWELFTKACENAAEPTEHLREIIAIADEENQYQILQSDGTTTEANTFLEGWEALTAHRTRLASIDFS